MMYDKIQVGGAKIKKFTFQFLGGGKKCIYNIHPTTRSENAVVWREFLSAQAFYKSLHGVCIWCLLNSLLYPLNIC